MKRILCFLIILTLILPLGISLPIYLKPLSSGETQPSTYFNYTFNFTVDSACNSVVFSNISLNILTDSTGIGFVDLNLSFSQIPVYLCEYKNGALRKVHTLSDQVFKNIYSNSINVSNNISADWFKGKLNWSYIQNPPDILNFDNNTGTVNNSLLLGGNNLTLIRNHSLMNTIQGGSPNEYYHVNFTTYDYLIANLWNFITSAVDSWAGNYTSYYNKTEVDNNLSLYAKYSFGNNNFTGTGNFKTSSGKITIGNANSLTYSDFNIYKNAVDVGISAWFGMESRVDSNASVNGTNYIIGYETDLYNGMAISENVTDLGYRVGVRAQAFPNTYDFKGTLTDEIGFWTRAGANKGSAGSKITNVYANKVELLTHTNVTITNGYGVYISTSGTNITNWYDLYASDTGAKNYFAGNVGIGTTSPSAKLDVRGVGNFSGTIYINNATDVSTLGGGNASWNESKAVGMFVQNNSGSAGYIPQWQNSNTINNSVIYQNGTNVGIGTTNPLYKLDTSGSIRASSTIANTDTYNMYSALSQSATTAGAKDAYAMRFSLGTTVTVNSSIYGIGVFGDLGNVGISSGVKDSGYRTGLYSEGYINNINNQGTLSATYGTRVSSGIAVTGVGGKVNTAYGHYIRMFNDNANGTIDTAYGIYLEPFGTAGTYTNQRYAIYQAGASDPNYFAGNVGIGTTSPGTIFNIVKAGTGFRQQSAASNWQGLDIVTSAGAAVQIHEQYSGTESEQDLILGTYTNRANQLVLDTTGNVGIGTTSPTQRLDVRGNVNVSQNITFGDAKAKLFSNLANDIMMRVADQAYSFTIYVNNTEAFKIIPKGSDDYIILNSSTIEMSKLNGSGNAYLCVNGSGHLYRNSVSCA